MKKRLLTAVVGALAAGAVVAPSAGARADTTITEVCLSGATATLDANGYGGITTAEAGYNANNPSGDFCYIINPPG